MVALKQTLLTGLLVLAASFVLAEKELDRDLQRLRPDMLAPEDYSTVERLALVIGNADYAHQSLRNPVHDAEDVARVLGDLGFDVIYGHDLDKKGMMAKMREFSARLEQTRGVGFFYYAGHGAQFEGVNYLIPLDAEIDFEDDIPSEAVSAERILARMDAAANKVNIVVLDACRNNPFPKGFSRSGGAGLAGMDATQRAVGTYIAYATGKGSTAGDGRGRNSPFAKHLVGALQVPGLDLEDVFKQVRGRVKLETGGRQTPWTESSLVGSFYFTPPVGGAPIIPTYVLPQPVEDNGFPGNRWLLPLAVLMLGTVAGAVWYSRRTALMVAAGGGPLTRVSLGAMYSDRAVAYFCEAGSGRALAALLPGASLVVGRSGKAHLTLHDTTISARHAEFMADKNGRIAVTDLNSSNGVYLAGAQLSPGVATAIALEQPFHFGKSPLAFILRAPQES